MSELTKYQKFEVDDVSSYNFSVIGKSEISEISDHINTTHHKMLQNFSKSQSNFMDSMMVLKAPTTIRNLRQISAEIEKRKNALIETQFSMRKDVVEVKKLKFKIARTSSKLDKDLYQIEIEEIESGQLNTVSYIEASLKTILNLKRQYHDILKSKGVSDISELDFESEEEEYHIKTAIQQSFEDIMCSGRISVGNNKYLLQIGILPIQITSDIIAFINSDVKDKIEFDKFIHAQYLIYKGCVADELTRRGMKTSSHENAVLA